MKAIAVLLVVSLAAPAWAWGPCHAPYCAPRCGCGPGHSCGHGCGCGYAAGAAAGVLLLAVVGVVLVTRAFRGGDRVEQAALESAGRANQYGNYLIAMQYYNSYSRQQATPMSEAQWVRWRAARGLETLR